jgi:chaperonin cofactor prefoldin
MEVQNARVKTSKDVSVEETFKKPRQVQTTASDQETEKTTGTVIHRKDNSECMKRLEKHLTGIEKRTERLRTQTEKGTDERKDEDDK